MSNFDNDKMALIIGFTSLSFLLSFLPPFLPYGRLFPMLNIYTISFSLNMDVPKSEIK